MDLGKVIRRIEVPEPVEEPRELPQEEPVPEREKEPAHSRANPIAGLPVEEDSERLVEVPAPEDPVRLPQEAPAQPEPVPAGS